MIAVKSCPDLLVSLTMFPIDFSDPLTFAPRTNIKLDYSDFKWNLRANIGLVVMEVGANINVPVFDRLPEHSLTELPGPGYVKYFSHYSLSYIRRY